MNKIVDWSEKYRANKLEDLYINDGNKLKFIESYENNIPISMIFYGPSGVGKSSVARILIKKENFISKIINGSAERGIETVRDEIIDFCRVKMHNKKKIIFIDEGELFTSLAFNALKEIIERYYETCSFIICTNDLNKIPIAIQSRFQIFKFDKVQYNDSLLFVEKILQNENITYTKENLEEICKICNGDLRKTLKVLQQNIVENKLNDINVKIQDKHDEIYKIIKSKNILNLKEYFVENNIDNWDLLYKYLFDKSVNVKNLLTIGKYYIESKKEILDQSIVFVTMVCEMLNDKE